jgi:DNA-binding FadR family transcriptional regulator
MNAATDWLAYRRADIFFHLALAEAARAPRLLTAMTEVHGALNDLFDQVAHPETALDFSNDQHVRIVASLRDRNAGHAVAQMREHLESTERIVEGLLP